MSGKNKHWGSTLEVFLDEEGIHQAAKAEAVTRVLMWQLAEEIHKQGITKTQMAEQMHTPAVPRLIGFLRQRVTDAPTCRRPCRA